MNHEQEINTLKEKITTLEAEIQGLPNVVMDRLIEAYSSMPTLQRLCDSLQEHQEYS